MGHRALDGRKVLEEQVLRKLATMSELGSMLASRATSGWGPQHTFYLEWARWIGGRVPAHMCCPHKSRVEVINSSPRHFLP